jgi:PAT family beta-lactamase induction signal transducer AmpG
MAVVGWWSGYKLGGVIALFSADFLQKLGFENYWQLTFLILGVLIILMNIGLMFISENDSDERKHSQRLNDKILYEKLGNNNFFLN